MICERGDNGIVKLYYDETTLDFMWKYVIAIMVSFHFGYVIKKWLINDENVCMFGVQDLEIVNYR